MKKTTGDHLAEALFAEQGNPTSLTLNKTDLAIILNAAIKFADSTAVRFTKGKAK